LQEVEAQFFKIHIDMEENYLISGPVTPGLISELVERMGRNTNCGGHMLFLGQVRADEIGGKRVKAIEYSAYSEMVNVEAEKIKTTILTEFRDVKSIVIIHSTGIVKAGEISLLVLVSAGHRQEAMEGCNKTVEIIKADLPVWKKEIFEDDSHIWK
jgi:molybdopterin synthase catalytic subunit